jgi:hypothetical protein
MHSFGPQIEFPHSSDVRVGIPTVQRFWQLLVALVDEIPSRVPTPEWRPPGDREDPERSVRRATLDVHGRAHS